MKLKEKRTALLGQAKGVVDAVRAEGRDLNDSEQAKCDSLFREVEDVDKKIEAAEKSANLVAKLTGGVASEPPTDPPAGEVKAGGLAFTGRSAWAKHVTLQLAQKAQGMGVKALLTGEISTPSAVEVSALPAVPARLLDLVPREGLDEHTFAYLRQTTRTNNADVVADNATKPTSVFTFEEIEDRARVIAHLSEPFPIRYATDHTSMVQVLESQMEAGIFEALEDQIVNGDGTGENFTGLLNTSGISQVPYATDAITTLRKARTAQELKGERVTAVAMHPSDIEALDLLREDGSTGGFLLDTDAYERIFGKGVTGVPSVAVPVGQAIAGDWSTVRLRIREAASTLAATQAGDLFDKNQMKLRTEGRYGFQAFRPQALAVVDLVAG
ncbi:phage major capsid protein [Aeromicrobium sp. CTD01-1L150]|uniref:phage major capsid protein n=1 Tax=Aeromicrobium sp. CTD01-1L150 TaxID=3341830 RepID=UPI0035C26C27